MNLQFFMPTKLVMGENCIINNADILKKMGKKALVVTGNSSAKRNGSLADVEKALTENSQEYIIFDRVMSNPTVDCVYEGAGFARKEKADFIIAIGGGSPMDAAKAIAMMATNDGDLWDYVGGKTGKGQALRHEPLPLVCITTTAGTGSEADQWGVVTNEETNEKIGVGGYDASFPVVSIIDPELMVSVPPKFTAYQGFDALFHATEGYISKFASPMSDMYALTAIENVGNYLVRACRDGRDMEAREGMAFANTLSGVVMTVSVTTAEHSLEHAMSAYHPELPHGAGLIMISRAFYEFFIEKHACDQRFVRMAQALGMKDAARPEDFITMLVKLQENCGVADLKMSDYGMTPDEFDKLAANARETMGGLFAANPYAMTHEDCVEVYRKSYR